MSFHRIAAASVVTTLLVFAAAPQPVKEAAGKVQQQIGKVPKALDKQFRAIAAKDLERYPELAALFADKEPAAAPGVAMARQRPQPSPEAAAISKALGTMR